jgi:hypothetical protein
MHPALNFFVIAYIIVIGVSPPVCFNTDGKKVTINRKKCENEERVNADALIPRVSANPACFVSRGQCQQAMRIIGRLR